MTRADVASVLSSIVVDATKLYPEFGVLNAAAKAGDWRGVSTFFDRFRDASEHAAGAWIVADVPEAGKVLEDVIAQNRQATLPRVLLATHFIRVGWDARTGQRAKYVSREQFAEMHDWLRSAERLLIDVTAQEPGNVLAWNLRLTTCRGLELGQSEARRRYDRLAAYHPRFVAAQQGLLQQLCPKWGGSWDAAHAFAQDCWRSAPPGDGAGVVIGSVHLERWLDLGKTEGAEYLRQPAVHQELVAAAQSSVLHPAYRARFGWVGAHNQFAMLFAIIGDYPRAAQHFRVVGNLAGELPWKYYDADARVAFRQFRAKALAKG